VVSSDGNGYSTLRQEWPGESPVEFDFEHVRDCPLIVFQVGRLATFLAYELSEGEIQTGVVEAGTWRWSATRNLMRNGPPSGRFLQGHMYLSWGQEISVINVLTGNVVRRGVLDRPDERLIAYDNEIKLWDPAGDRQLPAGLGLLVSPTI
jgi:hypothetical protein